MAATAITAAQIYADTLRDGPTKDRTYKLLDAILKAWCAIDNHRLGAL